MISLKTKSDLRFHPAVLFTDELLTKQPVAESRSRMLPNTNHDSFNLSDSTLTSSYPPPLPPMPPCQGRQPFKRNSTLFIYLFSRTLTVDVLYTDVIPSTHLCRENKLNLRVAYQAKVFSTFLILGMFPYKKY